MLQVHGFEDKVAILDYLCGHKVTLLGGNKKTIDRVILRSKR